MRKLSILLASLFFLLVILSCNKSQTSSGVANVSPSPPPLVETITDAPRAFPDGTYHFIAPGSLRCMNISSNDQEARLKVNTCNDSDANEEITIRGYALQWRIHNYYCLEFVPGAGDTPPLQQNPCKDTNDQHWIMQRTSDGYWAIWNLGWNDHCITRPSNNQGEGDMVVLAKCSSSGTDGWDDSQKWTISEFTLVSPGHGPGPGPGPTPSADSQILDASECTKQPDFPYYNCKLRVRNNSGRDIHVATLQWTQLGIPPNGHEEAIITDLTIKGGKTSDVLKLVTSSDNNLGLPTRFFKLGAEYK